MRAAGRSGDRSGVRRRFTGLMLALALVLGTALLSGPPAALAELPQGNAVKDPEAILRNALPIKAPQLQDLQHRLESTSDDLRAKRWKPLAGEVTRSQSQLTGQRAAILANFPPEALPRAKALLDGLENQLQEVAAAAESRDRDAFLASRRTALATIGDAEALLVGDFPFAIPDEFDALPP